MGEVWKMKTLEVRHTQVNRQEPFRTFGEVAKQRNKLGLSDAIIDMTANI
jgi:hypothetical protein